MSDPTKTERELFEAWFLAVETGDGDIPVPTGPEDGERWDEYVSRHALALGAWRAAQGQDRAVGQAWDRFEAKNKELRERQAARSIPSGAEPEEAEEGQALIDKLSGILTRTVNALRGEPPPLTLWSWHDLPELAAALRKAGDKLSLAAQISGGTAGRDEGLVEAIDGWEAAALGERPSGAELPALTPQRIWIDTEFNEHAGRHELISMALVADDGQEWYRVLPCPRPGPWVAENVMPKLYRPASSREQFADDLREFLSQWDAIHVIGDWPTDIALFCDALIVGPGCRIDTPVLTLEVIRLDGDSADPHNALADARGIRDAHRRAILAASSQSAEAT